MLSGAGALCERALFNGGSQDENPRKQNAERPKTALRPIGSSLSPIPLLLTLPLLLWVNYLRSLEVGRRYRQRFGVGTAAAFGLR